MEIRKATVCDAQEGCVVLRRSIIELCGKDHASDPETISAWTANKTSECWLNWVNQSMGSLYVAEDNGQIVGVCMISKEGEIFLNYVSPDFRFKGVSKAMLQHMEEEALAKGIEWCTLETTETARLFYSSAGYEFFMDDLHEHRRMRKRLTRIDS